MQVELMSIAAEVEKGSDSKVSIQEKKQLGLGAANS